MTTQVRSIVLIYMLLAFASAVLNAQEKLGNGYRVGADGSLIIADSLLPNYLLNYGAAGVFRKGLYLSAEAYDALDKLIAIPVLVGKDISREQSQAMFLRSVRFNLTGLDPEGAYQNPSGGVNITLSASARELVGKDFTGIGKLYEAQLKLGNVLVVDGETFFPLMIGGSSYARELELSSEQGHYYNALYGWAAAYPWFYYGISNVALKQALSAKNVRLVSLFGQNRFLLNEQLHAYLLDSKILVKPAP